MAITWTLAELRAEWRKHTGRSQTTDISDSDVNDLINDYYVNKFPQDAKVDEFDGFFTQELTATDSGIYSLAQNIDRLDEPVTINGNPIFYERNREKFFSGHGNTVITNPYFHYDQLNSLGLGKYEDEQYITAPGLSIGTGDTTKVLHSAFKYQINNYSYSKASSEVALTGSTVPQNKYGAWSLKIDEDGTITVTAATDNATGYDTARLALEGIEEADNTSAFMGYVTVISTDAGGFVPATTALDDAAVTDTYTDGRFEIRGTPVTALLYGQNLYVRPKPNDTYQLKALTIADRPTALSGDADAPADLKWGPMIALGAAILYLAPKGSSERLNDLIQTMNEYKEGINMDKYRRQKNKIMQGTF